MFQRLYELGRLLSQGDEKEDWQRLNEGMPPEYDRGVAICFDDEGNYMHCRGVHGNKGVVYRSGPPNGTDFTLCCKIAKSTGERLLRAACNLLESDALSNADHDWLDRAIRDYRDRQSEIWEEVESQSKNLGVDGKGHRAYVFWAGGCPERPVYAWHASRKMLVDSFMKSLGDGKHQRTCYVCGREKETEPVFGNYSVLSCYNLDKPGSIAGGFRRSLAHRNFPVCTSCTVALSEAVSCALECLASSMAGQDYLILPYANSEHVRRQIHLTLGRNPGQFRLDGRLDLIADESVLLSELGGLGDQIAYYLVFFREGKADWRILAEVQQLLPSRLKFIHGVTRELERAQDLETVSEKDGIRERKAFRMSSNLFRRFAAVRERDSSEYFCAWLAALFEGKAIDFGLFIHHLVSTILDTEKEDPRFLNMVTRQAWGMYRFAHETGLIVLPPASRGECMEQALPRSEYGKYISEHPEFFNGPEKTVAFLTGCYVAKVMAAQYRSRDGATPFGKKFFGRLVTKKLLHRLYCEGQDKLAAYDKLGFVMRGIDPDLAHAWIACGDRWELADEDATFAFKLGYSLEHRIRAAEAGTDESDSPEDLTDTTEE